MKRLVFAMALAGIFVVAQVEGFACFVLKPDVPEAFDRAKAVFMGQVVEISEPLTSQPGASLARRFHRVTFKTTYSWKGAGFRDVGAEMVVLSDQGIAGDCLSWGSFIEGREYLVYADETAEKDLVVHSANRTVSLSNASEDLKALERMSYPFFQLKYRRLASVVEFPSLE